MTVMLPFETPRVETRFKAPLLSASMRITRQAAANAIRRWWNINSDQERAELGMVISRSDIINRNNEIGNPIPVAVFSSPAPDGHEVLLAAFSDQSAVALRARTPGTWSGPTRKGHPDDLFTVFPVVLRMASVARPKDPGFLPHDGLGDIVLNMRGSKSPILALAREKSDGGWVNAEAGWTCDIDGLDEDRRAEILIELGREAAAWAALSGEIPPLVLPETGRAPGGPISAARAGQTGLEQGVVVAAPAALEWAAFTQDEAKEMSAFALDLVRWMQIRTECRWEQISIDIISAQPRQRPGRDEPVVKVLLSGNGVRQEGAAAKKHLSDCALRILRAGVGPLPFERMIGQVERDYRNRRTWMEGVTLASRLALCDISLSNHEIMQLRQKFDPYWI